MDARTYLDTYGSEGAEALARAVQKAKGKLTAGYFKQIAYGYRRPSFDLAEIMVAKDPKRKLDLTSLMRARKAKPEPRGESRAAQ